MGGRIVGGSGCDFGVVLALSAMVNLEGGVGFDIVGMLSDDEETRLRYNQRRSL
jgi:hypothetical protein